MKRRTAWSWLVACLCTVSAWGGEIRIAGSDLLGEAWAQAIRECAVRHRAELRLHLDGSRSGWKDVLAGRADLGVVSFATEAETVPDEFERLPLAYHVITAAARPELALQSLSIEQLAVVFGDRTEKTPWAGHLWLGDSDHTAELVRGLLLSGHALHATVRWHRSAPELQATLPGTPAIVLLPGLDTGKLELRPLALQRTADEAGVLPMPESVHAGTYPLRLPVWLVFRRVATPALFPCLRLLLSDESAAALTRARLVPVPRAARQEAVFAVEARIAQTQK